MSRGTARHEETHSQWRLLWLHVWVLCGLAAAPLFDVIRLHPEFLIANDVGPSRLGMLLAAVLVVAPAPLVLLALGLRSSARAWPALLPAVPIGLLGLYLSRRLGLGLVGLTVAVLLAALAAWLYRRSPTVRRYLTWLALVALVAPVHLLVDPSVRRLTAGDVVVDGAGEALSGPPMVILLLDELPITSLLDSAGSLDRRRFPHLAALADRAHWFDNVLSVDPRTEKAVPAVLTGAVVPDGALPIAGDLPDNLFTLLAPRYRISAIEAASRLCPAPLNRFARDHRVLGESSWLLDVGVVALHLWMPRPWADDWLPPINGAWRGFAGGRAVAGGRVQELWSRLLGVRAGATPRDRAGRFRAFLGAMDESREGALYFAHVMLPHRPWMHMPTGEIYLADSYREIRDFMMGTWPEGSTLAAQAYQRHLLQTEFTDRLVGELVARLEELEIFDEALIAITADHGISFRPGDSVRTLSATNAEDLLQVPLLLKMPRQREGVRHSQRRSTLDLLPTLLTTVGAGVPPGVEGEPLLRPSTEPAEARQWSGLANRHALFGDLERPEDLFTYGRFEEWTGRRVETLEAQPHEEIAVKILGPGARRVYRGDGDPLPAWVFGYIQSPVEIEGFGILVAVDGEIAATADCRKVEGRFRFNVLLPTSALPPGDHDLEVLLVEPASGEVWRARDGGAGS